MGTAFLRKKGWDDEAIFSQSWTKFFMVKGLSGLQETYTTRLMLGFLRRRLITPSPEIIDCKIVKLVSIFKLATLQKYVRGLILWDYYQYSILSQNEVLTTLQRYDLVQG
jgi:hypothetical protein